MVLRCISTYGTDSLHIWKGAIDAERYKLVFPNHDCELTYKVIEA